VTKHYDLVTKSLGLVASWLLINEKVNFDPVYFFVSFAINHFPNFNKEYHKALEFQLPQHSFGADDCTI